MEVFRVERREDLVAIKIHVLKQYILVVQHSIKTSFDVFLAD